MWARAGLEWELPTRRDADGVTRERLRPRAPPDARPRRHCARAPRPPRPRPGGRRRSLAALLSSNASRPLRFARSANRGLSWLIIRAGRAMPGRPGTAFGVKRAARH